MRSIAPSVEGLAPECIESLRTIRYQLAAAGFSESGLRERLAIGETIIASFYLDSLNNSHLVYPKEGPSTLDLLISLLLLGDAVDARAVEVALTGDAWDALEAARLVVREGEAIRATACWVPVFGVMCLCDFRYRRFEQDFVFLPDHSTAAIARYIEGWPAAGKLALDVGTGCGALALLQSRLGIFQRVVGQDINARAIQFARVAAVVNDLDAEFEVADAHSAGSMPEGTVDLLTFTLPQMYTARFTPAVAVHADHGDGLLDVVYGSMDRLLAAGGQAILFHQARCPVAVELPERIASVKGSDRLSIEFVSLPNKLVNADFGLAVVRRRQPDEEPFHHHESTALEVDRRTLDSWRHAAALIASGRWLDVKIALRPGLVLLETRIEQEGRLVSVGQLVGSAPLEPELSEIIYRIDGTSCLRELLGANAPDAVRSALERALRRGDLVLTPGIGSGAKRAR